jgi:Domain of unknown function (DUF4932)/Bacterial Ig-like domain
VSLTAAAQAPRVAVDPRVELMSVIFRLAGNSEYNQGRVPAYNAAIDKWFAPFRDHEAVQVAREFRTKYGASFDAPMAMAVNLKDIDTLAERVPVDAKESHLDARWHGKEARRFLAAARRFVADAKFTDFLASQKEFYDRTAADLRAIVDQADFNWFEKFFGIRAGARFYVIPGLVNGGGSYGPSIHAEDGVEENYQIIGVWQVDDAGRPVFDKALVSTIVHEGTHPYANPLVESVIRQIDLQGAAIFEAEREAMRRQAYGEGPTVLKESLVRASSARYALAHDGPDAAKRHIAYERGRGFLWTGELYELLGQHEADRTKYPTMQAFLPRLVEYFNGLSGRAAEMARAAAAATPKVASIAPGNGTQDVDPALTEIVVKFDRPMDRKHYSVMKSEDGEWPKVEGVTFDESGTVFTMRVKLEPRHAYAFGLNGAMGGSFASADGTTLPEVLVKFRTRQ